MFEIIQGSKYRKIGDITTGKVAVQILSNINDDTDIVVSKITKYEEFKILNSLNHPNIIKPIVYRAGSMILPYYPICLHNVILSITDEQMNKYMLQLLDALNYIHKQGYIHGDIKSTNILIDKNDNAILIDFDFVKEIQSENISYPLYPPEMINPIYKPSYDVFMFGHLLYFYVSGSFLISTSAQNNKSYIDQLNDSLSSKNPYYCILQEDYPIAIQCLNIDPSKRPTIDEIINSLQNRSK